MAPRVAGLEGWEEIGRGGFAIVYRADDLAHGRVVAVKVLRGGELEADDQARFERECRAAGSLSGHPNIVSLHTSGSTEAGEPYLVMDLLDGGSLTQRVADRGSLAPGEVIDLGVSLAGALAAAHDRGIVHRDVKPENVLFSAFDTPQLVDFGIARMASEFETRSSSISASLAHAAPEVLAGASSGPAGDLYSLASVLHLACAGEAPFHVAGEETLAPLIARISSSPPPDLRERGVPDALASVIERGLAKEPSDRPSSAVLFAEQLRQVASELGHVAPRVPMAIAGRRSTVADTGDSTQRTTPRTVPGSSVALSTPDTSPPSRRGLVAAAVAIALLLVAGAAYAVTRSGDTSGPTRPPEKPRGATSTPAAVDQDGLHIVRRFVVGPSGPISSKVDLANTTDAPIRRLWFEVVPKELATRVADVTFDREPDGVVVDDPVVYWVVTLDPGAHRTIEWSTPVPKRGSRSADYLRRVERYHRTAVKAAQGPITYVSASLASQTGAAAVVPAVPAAPGGSAEGGGTTTPSDPGGAGSGEVGTGGTGASGGGFGQSAGGSDGGTGTGGSTGGGGSTRTSAPVTQAPPTTRISAPGAPSGVIVRDPSGDQNSQSVQLVWSAPGSTGGQLSGYRIRRQLYRLNLTNDGCVGSPIAVAAASEDTTGTGTSTTRSVTTAPACSWMVWQVAAYNSAGPGPWTTATGIMPNVVGRLWSYHLVRSVGGLAVSGGTVSCGMASSAACSSSPAAGASIAPGTGVSIVSNP